MRTLLIFLGLLAVAACGRVGPLELPPPPAGEAPAPQEEDAPKPEKRIFLDKLI